MHEQLHCILQMLYAMEQLEHSSWGKALHHQTQSDRRPGELQRMPQGNSESDDLQAQE